MDHNKEKGFATLVMVMGFGLAIGASVYGTYNLSQNNGQLQGDSQNRNASELRAMQLLDAAAASLNNTYCGTPNGVCAAANADAAAVAAVPAATLIQDDTGTVTVTNNTFGANSLIRVRANATQNGSSSTMDAYMMAAPDQMTNIIQVIQVPNPPIEVTVTETVNTLSSYMTLFKGDVTVSGNFSVVGFDSTTQTCTSTATTDSNAAIAATGNLSASGSASVAYGTAGGSVSDGNGHTNRIVNETANSTAVANFTVDVNAYNLFDEANFIFTLGASNVPRVSFDNLIGLPSGYTSLTLNTTTGDYELTSAATVFSSVCSGSSVCVKYTPSSQTWTVQNVPQSGVFFFDGNALWSASDSGMSNTVTYYNSVIATGDISTAQSHITAYGNKPGVCSGTYRPNNVCNGTSASGTVADLLFLAGGVYPGTSNGNTLGSIFGLASGANTGGDIHLKTNSFFHGAILARDDIDTSGNTVVAGKLMAQNVRSVAAGTEGNSTDGKIYNGNVTLCLDSTITNADSGGHGTGSTTTTITQQQDGGTTNQNVTVSVQAYVFRPFWVRHM